MKTVCNVLSEPIECLLVVFHAGLSCCEYRMCL